MKRQVTRKLFYGKWAYKIQCESVGSHIIGAWGIDRALTEIHNVKDKKIQPWWTHGRDIQDLHDFVIAVSPFIATGIKIRSEGRWFSLFFKEKTQFEAALTALEKWVIVISEPGSEKEFEFLCANGRKKTICKEYPHRAYRFKIYVNRTTNDDIKLRFTAWIEKYGEKIRYTGNTEKWLTMANCRWIDPYFYIADDKMLSMIILYLGNNILKVEEFILDSSINS